MLILTLPKKTDNFGLDLENFSRKQNGSWSA